jgi:hypothetical protein
MQKLDFFAPFVYFFKVKGWFKKFVLASLLTATIIGVAPILGWTLEIVRRVAHDEKPDVPELTDWKTYWHLGGQFTFVNTIWLLPVLLAVILLYLPLIFASRLQGQTQLVVWVATLVCVLIFLMVHTVLYIFLLPSMLIHLVETGSVWKAVNPLGLWKVARLHFIEHLIVYFIVGIGLLNLMLFTAPFTLFLLLPSMLVYMSLVTAHYAGQLMRMDHLPT